MLAAAVPTSRSRVTNRSLTTSREGESHMAGAAAPPILASTGAADCRRGRRRHTDVSSSVGSADEGGGTHEEPSRGLLSRQRCNFPFRCQISSLPRPASMFMAFPISLVRPRSFDSSSSIAQESSSSCSVQCILSYLQLLLKCRGSSN
ncbi:unnamed protein product [Urochloa humidicola]